MLIIAGIHGQEHSGIQAAYELLGYLSAIPLEGRVDFLPVCNPMSYAAGTRFTPKSDRDMARAFTHAEPSDMTEALAHAILKLAEDAEIVLNLHSAGDARYLSHVIFYREQDAKKAAEIGFPFVIKRGTPKSLANHIASHMRTDQLTVTLEIGGGTVAYHEDVELSVDLILAYLARNGVIHLDNPHREPTASDRIWMTDDRHFIRATEEGVFYSDAQLGEVFTQGQPFGFWVGLNNHRPNLLPTPLDGMLIYIRTRNRVPAGETLAMFLPLNEPESERT